MEQDAPVRPIAITHRRVAALALPMTLSHITTPLLGLVDAAVIGRLGEAHLLGAVALGAVVFDFLFWTFGSLRMATAGMTAQAKGARNLREIDRIAARALAVGALAGFLLILLQAPLAALAFPLVGASEAVTQALAAYFFIRIWAAPFTLANYVFLGSVLGRGRTDIGLLLQVSINLANIALTALLVLGLGFGIEGAALGTVAAEIFGAGLGAFALRRLGSNPFRVRFTEIADKAAMLATLAVNRDIMIRNISLIAAFSIFSSLGARSGDLPLAANAILYNLFLIGGYFLDGFATAAETLCGQCVGARDRRGFGRGVAISMIWSLAFGLGLCALFLAGGGAFIDFVSTNAEVRAYAREFLVFAALTPLLGAPAFAFDGIYTGATWTGAMRNIMLASLAVFVLVLLIMREAGNHGLWTAFLIFLATRGAGHAALLPSLTRKAFPAPTRAPSG